MQINISVRHGHLRETTRAKIESKLSRLVRYFDRLTAVNLTIEMSNSESPRAELQLNAEHKHDFVAKDQATTVMECVDNVLSKLQQQLRRHKEKVQDRHRNARSNSARRADRNSAGEDEE